MEALLILGALASNIVIGACVWVAIDDADQRYFQWFASCPPHIAFVAQPIVLSAWPVGVWFWWHDSNSEGMI